MMWTAQSVRDQLPDVTVQLLNSVFPARVTGRKLPFAEIVLPSGPVFSVAWETVARCLNESKPIRY